MHRSRKTALHESPRTLGGELRRNLWLGSLGSLGSLLLLLLGGFLQVFKKKKTCWIVKGMFVELIYWFIWVLFFFRGYLCQSSVLFPLLMTLALLKKWGIKYKLISFTWLKNMFFIADWNTYTIISGWRIRNWWAYCVWNFRGLSFLWMRCQELLGAQVVAHQWPTT